MSRVIRADVPLPLWDTHRQVMVLPRQLSERAACAAVLELVRERRPADPVRGGVPRAESA